MVIGANTPALRKQYVLDAQWSDLSEELKDIVRGMWWILELGNDNYIHKTSINDLEEWEEEGFEPEVWKWGLAPEEKLGWVKEKGSLTPLIKFLEEKGLKPDENVWIHWWW